MTIEARFTVATNVIREAGELAAGYFAGRTALTRETKGPQDFVSIADREVESLIRTRLAEAFPTDGFLGEESGGGAGERCWVVDPIDGTNNFLRGLPLWGVSIAYAIAGEPVIGLIYLPCVGRLYSAVRGRGATCNDVPIHASLVGDLEQATILVGLSRRISPELSLPMIETVLRSGSAMRCMGTCVVALAMVAEGTAEAYYEAHVQPWDCLAGLLIVREAGGRTNDVPGPVMLAHGGPLLASSPALFDRLAAVASVVLDLGGSTLVESEPTSRISAKATTPELEMRGSLPPP
jgi:myo-inositol-1(or 4)-monophosphatase